MGRDEVPSTSWIQRFLHIHPPHVPDWLIGGLLIACVFAVGMLYGIYLCYFKWRLHGP